MWTTATLALHHKPMVLVDTDGFYDPLLAWLRDLTDQTFLKPAGFDLLRSVDTVPAALDLIESQLT